jgi:hypothetical protein
MSKRTILLVGMVLAAAMARLIPHYPNMTPIGAMALFGGACLADRRLAFLLPLAAMLLSDLVLGLTLYGMWTLVMIQPVVYGCILAYSAIGRWVVNHRSAWQIGGGALAGAVFFFLVTNFAVWAGGHPGEHSTTSLIQTYVAGIPFFRNMVIGDLAYSALLFGALALFESRLAWMRERTVPVPA